MKTEEQTSKMQYSNRIPYSTAVVQDIGLRFALLLGWHGGVTFLGFSDLAT
jgi:hypothetical protein